MGGRPLRSHLYSMHRDLRAIPSPNRNRTTNSISACTDEPRFGSGRVSRCLFPTIFCLFTGENPLPGAAPPHLDFPNAPHLGLCDAQRGLDRRLATVDIWSRRLDFLSFDALVASPLVTRAKAVVLRSTMK